MRDLSIPALHLIRTITLFISILLGLNVMVADTANTTACVPGVKLGAAIFNSPNVSSVLVVGASYNISWRYGALATKPPSAVDVLIQPYSNGAIEKWDQLVIDGYNGTDGRPPTSYIWDPVPSYSDGYYKFRVRTAGKDNFIAPGQSPPKEPVCFADGEMLPSVSALFKLMNPVMLVPTKDPLPPYSGVTRIGQSLGWIIAPIALFCRIMF